jgi:acyl-CoA-binding protein
VKIVKILSNNNEWYLFPFSQEDAQKEYVALVESLLGKFNLHAI